jgi:hypothetical protein
MKYPCPCCGFLTFDEEPIGTYQICPVCYWEDDPVQFADPSYTGGANRVSLTVARRNFQEFGAIEERLIKYTRLPKADEFPAKRAKGSP